jgi:hypothetical protein
MNKLPAARGLAWFSGSLQLIKAQPARLLLIGLVLQFLMGLTQMGAAGILFVLAIPALTAGVLQAMLIVEQGSRPPLMSLFVVFSSPDRLLRLFFLSAITIAIATLAAGAILAGSADLLDQELLTSLEKGDVGALSMLDPELLVRIAYAVIVGLFVSGTLGYFSIPLVWFHDQPAGAALMNGLVGLLKNWLPFLVLGGLLAVVSLPVALLTVTMLATSASAGGASTILTLIMLLVMVAYQLLMFGAQYVSFKEVFGTGQQSEPPADDSQLVA